MRIRGRGGLTSVSLVLPGYAAIKSFAIATCTDNAIAGLASLNTTSAAGGCTGGCTGLSVTVHA
jgi:pectate lyase